MAQVHNECWVLAVRKQAGEVGWIQRRVFQVNLRLSGGGRAAAQMAMNTSHVKDLLLTWGMCNCWYVFSRLRHRRLPSTSNSLWLAGVQGWERSPESPWIDGLP